MTDVLLRPSPAASARRDGDIHAWALRQERALREGRSAELDLARLADEIDALGRSEYLRLRSALLRLLQHLLKWDHQPQRRSRSWADTIAEQRERVFDQLRDNPSLKARQAAVFDEAYRKGRTAMLRETGLPDAAIPESKPYPFDEAMTRPIVWPEP